MKSPSTNENSFMYSTTIKGNLSLKKTPVYLGVFKPPQCCLKQQTAFLNKARVNSCCSKYRKTDLYTWLAGKEV